MPGAGSPQAARGARQVVVANPSADVYGADLQLLESVSALVQAGYAVTVATPDNGPLVERLVARGAHVEQLSYPVLRKSFATVAGAVRLGLTGASSALSLARLLRSRRPDLLYVNTVTLPWWVLAGRLAGVRVLCHVHEAEQAERRVVRRVLYLPLLGAHLVVANSEATRETITQAVPSLAHRLTVVYNGVPGPDGAVAGMEASRVPFRLALLSRLSPRKGVDVALEALALVRRAGRDVRLDICGTAFEGYEWFAQQLRERAQQQDLAGAVVFHGYVSPVWPVLAEAHAVLATSLGESLGNNVIEAQLAGRPVIATAVTGHTETVRNGVTGLLVPPREPQALADAVERLARDPQLAARLGSRARAEAQRRFGVERYRQQIQEVAAGLART